MIEVAPASALAAEALAAIHAEAFDDAWSAADIATLLESPGVFALAADEAGEPAGFILCRVAVDEAEVLTIATRPAHRRRGIAAALLASGMSAAAGAGAASVFLEVAVDNPGAVALYRSQGFSEVGRRPNYYARAEGAVSALIMRLDLNR